MHSARWWLTIALCCAGCGGGPKYVPVSGVVTLDGKPGADLVVLFLPQASEGNQNPGRGSSAYTGKDGRYQLKTMDGDEGAVVGKHLVQIMSKGSTLAIDPELGSPDDLPAGTRLTANPIPADWTNPGKPFEVPGAGTDQANFNIQRGK
jgi:hypothetical protein